VALSRGAVTRRLSALRWCDRVGGGAIKLVVVRQSDCEERKKKGEGVRQRRLKAQKNEGVKKRVKAQMRMKARFKNLHLKKLSVMLITTVQAETVVTNFSVTLITTVQVGIIIKISLVTPITTIQA